VSHNDINPGYRTDHSLVTIQFDLNNMERGRGYWKFNNSFLRDKDYIKLVKKTISEVVTMYAATPYRISNLNSIHPRDIHFTINDQLFFEMILLEIRAKTISYGAHKKKEAAKLERELENDINRLFLQVSQGEQNLSHQLNAKQNDLANMRKDKMEGVFIRTKSRWFEQGEKPSKYFLNMEKRNYVNKTMTKVVSSDGNDILLEARSFYKNLYSEHEIDKNIDISTFFANSDTPVLSNDQRESLEGPITYKELLEALKSSKNGKSPGSDGFGFEFYKFFFNDISWYLLRSLNHAYTCGKLSPTQSLDIITLLPKGDKPRQFLKNWRPISLLNVSYKLASACIANRIKPHLPDIIHENQKGFVSGRYIGENIRLMYDLMNYTENNNIPGLFLMIDFEKAFDTVSHHFLFKVLDNFNFGPSIKQWIKTFYNNATASVLVNGFLSESFKVERGCRQGDGLSPYLFVLCVEVLGKMIRSNNIIKGIKIDNVEFCLSQYADDTALILDGTDTSMNETFNVLDLFEKISGLKVNVEKTLASWVGSKKGSRDKICDHIKVKWVEHQDSFRALGVDFSVSLESMIDINYNKVMTSIKTLIHHWSRRNLTVLGRVTVAKSLLLSKITFLVLTIPDPSQDFIKELNRIINAFIWKGVDKVTRNQMMQDYDKGGVRMVDIQSYIQALKSTWIRRLILKNGAEWVFLFCKITKIKRISNIEGGSIEIINDMLNSNNPNQFWKDVFNAWAKVTDCHQPINYEQVQRSLLWYNENIKVGKKTLYYYHWVKNGVDFVNDLLDNNGNFLTLEAFRNKFNVRTNFLEYGGLVRAIKRSFSDIMDNPGANLLRPYRPFHYRMLLKDLKGSRRIYDILVSSKVITRKYVVKWELKLGKVYTHHTWSIIFNSPFISTTCTKYRWFQFRLIHRILGTNSFLLKIGKTNSGMCSFCYNAEETLIHLFCDCNISLNFWIDFQKWLKERVKVDITLDNDTLLFGTLKGNKILDLILILCRYHIYKMKMCTKVPSLKVFQIEVKNYYLLEKYIYTCNNDIGKFYKKWSIFNALFND